jgi:uncharacterized protein (DUF2336 family)
MSVNQLLDQLNGQDGDARMQVARRVGLHLCDDVLSEADRRAAELLARALVDDAIEGVRCELSKAIGHAKHLPRDLALKLAHDVDSVACPFLEVTEVFTDSDWQQLILTISRGARNAVAKRTSMSDVIATTLAQVGESIVAQTLIENPSAPMTGAVCYALMDRFAPEIWVLDKLAHRDDLISDVATKLTTIVSAAARAKIESQYGLSEAVEQVTLEAETGALLRVVKQTPKTDQSAIAEELHKNGNLAPPLVLRALQENHLEFLEAALSVLAGRSHEHVRSVILRAGMDAVVQLLNRAKIPSDMHKEFCTSLVHFRQNSK